MYFPIISGTGLATTYMVSFMQVALYARVSTTDQSCEMQLRELREYAARRGWDIAGEYVDTGWSGAKANRPELNRLMADAQMRRFDAVVCWKLDRFGRSLVNCVSAIQELSTLGVRFLAVSQGLDTDQANPDVTTPATHFGCRRAV